MHSVSVRNVNDALRECLWLIKVDGKEVPTRNGPALRLHEPMCLTYLRPVERVLFWDKRDANPFFHFMEALWMLRGRHDVGFLTRFVKRMAEYSDNGEQLHGAYGWRWRRHFMFDQIPRITELLRKNPDSRRAVLTMWDPGYDLCNNPESKDLPCNLNVIFQIQRGALDMTVTNRSNDSIWGMCGANAVHFSFLQEYIANHLYIPVGAYHQFSVNAHCYLTPQYDLLTKVPESDDRYTNVNLTPLRMPAELAAWDEDLIKFFTYPSEEQDFQTEYFNSVVAMMWGAHAAYKEKEAWRPYIDAMLDCDWKVVCAEWLERRCKK
jgi:thymidylate synthase